MRVFVGAGAASALCALAPATVLADSLLYDNGADNFPKTVTPTEQIFSINQSPTGTAAVSDDFTLSSPATLDRVVFAELTLNFGTSGAPIPATVNWCIGTSFFACNTGQGTATLTSAQRGTSGPFYDFASTLSLPNLSLNAGKYYLTLGSATDVLSTTPHNNDYWSTTGGTGDGEGQTVFLGKTSTSPLKYEPSFEVYGTPGGGSGGSGGGGGTSGGGGGGSVTGVPEPHTLFLLSGGLLWLALSRRRARHG